MKIVMKEWIDELGLNDINPDEAECIVYAWLLKTKIYLIGSSHKWSKKGKETLDHELEVINTR